MQVTSLGSQCFIVYVCRKNAHTVLYVYIVLDRIKIKKDRKTALVKINCDNTEEFSEDWDKYS